MIDTPFQLLDSNSEETGLVCGIDGCIASTQPLESKKKSLGRAEWKTKWVEALPDAILLLLFTIMALELQLPE